MGARLLTGADAPGRKTVDRAIAILFVGSVFAAYALWAIRGAGRSSRFRRTGRWH